MARHQLLIMLKDFIKKTWHYFVIFLLSFTIYFTSSVGLYNSLDTPQFFTTEAILANQNLNLAPFSNDPHYFVYPDIFHLDGQVLGVRGYLTSLIALPLHLLGKVFSNYLIVNHFPSEVLTENFRYELFIVASFTIFTSIALVILANTLNILRVKRGLQLIIPLSFAFGTYSWKYASAYARHGLMVLLINIFLNLLLRYYQQKELFHFSLLLTVTAFSFGIDVFLFTVFCLTVLFLTLVLIKNNRIALKTYANSKNSIKILIIPTITISLLITTNLLVYKSPFSSQTTKQVTIKKAMGGESIATWLSTPIYPTLPVILFNTHKIPSKAFKNFQKLPPAVAKFCSMSFAQKMDFYGLFFLSPFLLFSITVFLLQDKKYKTLNTICLMSFFAGIALNCKVLNFWGGNQYDVRYFYPYTYFLSIPLALGIHKIFFQANNKLISIIGKTIFGVTVLFSLFINWLSVINMFKPALTGERKIFLNFWDFANYYQRYSLQDYLDATFMNRGNVIFPISFSLGLLIFSLFIIQTFKKIKHNKI